MAGLIHQIQYSIVTADTLIHSGATRLHGVIVTADVATNIITMRNGLTATGDIVLVIPTAANVPDYFECNGILLGIGLYASFTGTGTLCIAWSTEL